MAGILTAEDAAANRILPLVEKVEVAEPIDQHKDLEVCVHIGEAVQPPSPTPLWTAEKYVVRETDSGKYVARETAERARDAWALRAVRIGLPSLGGCRGLRCPGQRRWGRGRGSRGWR
jgi:hypothetical protein